MHTTMKYVPILIILLASCAKEKPRPPSTGGGPPPVVILFDPSAVPIQYTPQGTIPRAPITFRWSKVPGADRYRIEYQRDVITIPGAYTFWSSTTTTDTTATVPLPSGVINAGRWRVWTISTSGEFGYQSSWMYFSF
jgi:hypothetical protein